MKRNSLNTLLQIVISICPFLYSQRTFSQIPAPVACYNFSGDLNEANGGPPMQPINGLGSFTAGAAICGTDSIYNWAVDQGLDLPIGTLFATNNYTLEFLFEFTSHPYQRSWQRIVNFKNSGSDDGLYTFDNNMQMYLPPHGQPVTGTSNMATPLTWFRFFVTRDSLTGNMKLYINDSLQISLIDSVQEGVFISDLILFKDDSIVPNEESAGSIDYLRIYNQPLSHAQITQIVTTSSPVVAITGATSTCSGSAVTLTASGASNYVWSNGATTTSITVSPTVASTYSVKGWNSLFCTSQICDSTSYDTIRIAVTNGIQTSITTNDPCSGGKGSASVLATGGTGSYLYSWDNGEFTAQDTGLIPGTYIVTVTDSNGCMRKDSAIIVDSLLYSAAFPDTAVCAGIAVQLRSDGGTTYQWMPGTGLNDSTISNPVATLFATTTYTVTVSAGNCNATSSVTITIYPDPTTPVITQSPAGSSDSLFCSLSPSYTSFQWYSDTTLIAGATDTFYVAMQNGEYNVKVTNESGCEIAVGINVMIEGLQSWSMDPSDGEFTVSPNPAKDQFTVSSHQLAGKKVIIELYDALGEKLISRLLTANSSISGGPAILDVSAFAAGVYFVTVKTEDQSRMPVTHKIIIAK